MAVFSVADKLLLNPIPGRDIERLFVVHEVNVMSGFQWHASPQLYQELASHTNLVESLTYFDQGSEQKKIQLAEKTVKLRGAKVAPNFLELLGIRPLVARRASIRWRRCAMSDSKQGAERSGLMDWRMNGLMVSTSIDPIIQQSTHPFIR